jgi:hypothetical protein
MERLWWSRTCLSGTTEGQISPFPRLPHHQLNRNMENKSANSQATLLGLPRELRNEIYKHLLVSNSLAIRLPYFDDPVERNLPTRLKEPYLSNGKIGIELLLTCRQLNQEVLYFIHHNNALYFNRASDLPRVMVKIGQDVFASLSIVILKEKYTYPEVKNKKNSNSLRLSNIFDMLLPAKGLKFLMIILSMDYQMPIWSVAKATQHRDKKRQRLDDDDDYYAGLKVDVLSEKSSLFSHVRIDATEAAKKFAETHESLELVAADAQQAWLYQGVSTFVWVGDRVQVITNPGPRDVVLVDLDIHFQNPACKTDMIEKFKIFSANRSCNERSAANVVL